MSLFQTFVEQCIWNSIQEGNLAFMMDQILKATSFRLERQVKMKHDTPEQIIVNLNSRERDRMDGLECDMKKGGMSCCKHVTQDRKQKTCKVVDH